MITKIKDAQQLLEFAQKWYQTNPGEQIPHAVWTGQVDALLAGDPLEYTRFRVSSGEHSVIAHSPEIIPALAAISLGAMTSDIQAAALHHKIELGDLNSCKFEFVFKPADAKDRPLFTKWSVTKALMRAFCYTTEGAEHFFGSAPNQILSPTQLTATLTIPNPAVWPATGIEGHLELARQGRISGDTQLRPMLSAHHLTDAGIDLAHTTDAQLMTLLERSGNLSLGATSEMGFRCSFFDDLFAEFKFDGEKTAKHIIKVLTSLDEGRTEIVRQRMLEELCDIPEGSHWENAETVLDVLRDQFGHESFGQMHENMILKLNLIKVKGLDALAKVITRPMPECYKEFFSTGDQVLAKLDYALRAVEPDDFKAPHFRALRVASSDWNRPQDLSRIDLSALLDRCLKAYDRYQQQNHVDLTGAPQQKCKENARHDMVAFASYALKHIEHNYERFRTLSSECKTVLAMAGLEIKKLPGISRRERGLVLADQLGL